MRNNATTVFSVVVNDKAYDLNFTLQDAEGVVIDITGAALTFKAQLLADYDVQFQGDMVVISGVAGTCKYTVAEMDFPQPGIYNCQVVVDFNSGAKIITFDNIRATANARVPQ